MATPFPWIIFSRWDSQSFCTVWYSTLHDHLSLKSFHTVLFLPSDGRIWRIWRSEEKEVRQTDRFQCDDQFKGPWWGCWPVKSFRCCRFCKASTLVETRLSLGPIYYYFSFLCKFRCWIWYFLQISDLFQSFRVVGLGPIYYFVFLQLLKIRHIWWRNSDTGM